MNKMRVRTDVEPFLEFYCKKIRYDYNKQLIIGISGLFSILVSYGLFKIHPSPLLAMISLMVGLTLTICISYVAIQVKEEFNKREKLKILETFLNKLRTHTYQTDDYKCLNFLLLDKRFPDLVIQFFYVFSHFNGEWLDLNKIIIPASYGNKEDFFKNSFNFIAKHKQNPDFNLISCSHPELVSEYLHTLYPYRMEQLTNAL